MALNNSVKGKSYELLGFGWCVPHPLSAQREVAQGKNISGFMVRVSGLDDCLGTLKCKDWKFRD